MKFTTWTIATVFLFSSVTFAQKSSDKEKADKDDGKTSLEKAERAEILEIVGGLTYPELQVVPRASERLKIEAKEEEDSWYYTHWTMMVSGLATAGLGGMGKSQEREGLSATQKTDLTTVSTVTTAVGAGWFLTGFFLGMQRPYRSGAIVIGKYPGRDERSQLLRERLAEETLERPARTMRTLQYISVITNLGVAGVLATYLSDQGRLMAGVVGALAFLPLMFEDHTITVYEKHIEYKKKIYTPISSGVGLLYSPGDKKLVPGAQLAWSF